MALSELKIRGAKPKSSQYKLYDEDGLLLLVRPSGGKLWRLKYRIAGKEQQLALGRYPDTGLKDARTLRDEARKLLAGGVDPAKHKRLTAVTKATAASNTFKLIAEELIAKKAKEGRADATLKKSKWLLGLFSPALLASPVNEIGPQQLLGELKKVEGAGHYETATRMRSFASQVFRYGIATTRGDRNPAADLQGALITPKVTHHAAILVPERVGGLLRSIDGFEGQPMTKLALRLAPHVFVRPNELRKAEWSEFHLADAVWRIPGSKMKMRKDHMVPLSRQSVAILTSAKALTGYGKYVFPSIRALSRPMSENTLNGALRRLGYSKEEMTTHGFRSVASTLLNESGKWNPDAIERALAHQDADETRSAYHRGQHWDERVQMAQWWSDYLDLLRDGGQVIPFEGRKTA